jgi:hypothetical protein
LRFVKERSIKRFEEQERRIQNFIRKSGVEDEDEIVMKLWEEEMSHALVIVAKNIKSAVKNRTQ